VLVRYERLSELPYQQRLVGQVDKLTCRETEKCKKGNANPFRGDIIILELRLVAIGAVGRAFRLFRMVLRKDMQVKERERNTHSSSERGLRQLELARESTRHAFISCHQKRSRSHTI